MAAIVGDLQILEPVIEQRIRPAVDDETRQRVWRARELQIDLFQMVAIQVAVAAGPDELAEHWLASRAQPADERSGGRNEDSLSPAQQEAWEVLAERVNAARSVY